MRISDPIFVRGMSRSGGTLLCTLLDAHKDIAMSYELYPSLLEVENVDLSAIADEIDKARLGVALRNIAPTPGFATFVTRCERGGLTYSDFARLLHQLVDEGHSLAVVRGRMRLIELCGLEKMKRERKKRWGMKCNGAFRRYLKHWPDAHFLNMMRDGRDVLASQLKTGNFKNTPTDVAQGWRTTHRKFQKLVDRDDVNARIVRYEALTREAEAELREICDFLGVEFDPAMLRHHELDLTVFKANHLSRDRINKTIDATKIGRWKQDLTEKQLKQFLAVAKDDLKLHGYI